MNGLPDGIVTAEGKGNVAHAAGALGMGQVVAYPAAGVDEIHRVVGVLLDAGSDGEDVGVENDVFGWETYALGKQIVRAPADLLLACQSVCLSGLIESHHHHRGPVCQALFRGGNELFLTFLQADGIHYTLALNAAQAGFDDVPTAGIDHHRHAGDVWLCGQQVQKPHHGLAAVQHALIHVHIDDLGSVFYLLARHLQAGVVIAFPDQARKPG